MTPTSPPEQGQLVQVRSRPWVVNVVKPSNLPTPAMQSPVGGAQNLLTLSSVEDDGLGEELQVVWEIEPGAKIVEKVALPEPTDFDAPEKLDAFLDAVRWGAASTADVKNIQSPFRSGIEIEDYQLDPVVRAIQMPRVNLLIADDVGLQIGVGKRAARVADLLHQCQEVRHAVARQVEVAEPGGERSLSGIGRHFGLRALGHVDGADVEEVHSGGRPPGLP